MRVAITGAGVAFIPRVAWPFSQSPVGLKKFIQALPGLGPDGIPVATADTFTVPGSDFYRLEVGQYSQSFHPDLPPSTLRGYADSAFGLKGCKPNYRYLGGVIVAKKSRPAWVRIKNNLPKGPHPLPVDTGIMGVVKGQNENRTCTHLHGGQVPWTSDGGPYAWSDPQGNVGPSFIPHVNGTGVPGETQLFYPNDQSARLMWYHDHVVGITRLNAYVGIVSAYIIRDDTEEALIKAKVLPSNEIPLIIQDKTFVTHEAIKDGYAWGKVGDLWYPWKYEASSLPDGTGRWDYGPDMTPPSVLPPGNQKLPTPSIVPEFFSDTAIVNGAAYPYVKVEPRHYRFRILNGSQARFYNLQLYFEDALNPGEADLTHAGPRIIQIGTEGGFLPVPVALNNPPQQIAFDPVTENAIQYTLLLAPAERADVVIDFSNAPVGSKLILYSDAPAPFPGGDTRNDYFTGNPDQTSTGGAPSTQEGRGPNTRTLLQFQVTALVGAKDPASMNILEEAAVNGSASGSVAHGASLLLAARRPGLSPKSACKVRELTLNEDFDEFGRLIQTLGTTSSQSNNNQGLPTWGLGYMDKPTEVVKAGTVEIWKIYNLTGDTHPIHFHLVNVQVLSRQGFDVDKFLTQKGAIALTGTPRLPDLNERGYKETVRMNPGEVTTVMMRFDLARAPFFVPESPRTGGYEYVWHCHILEHEEHDMMRPLVVKP